MGGGVSGVSGGQQTQDPLQIKRSTQSGISNITESIMTGDNIGKAAGDAVKGIGENAVNAVKNQVMDAIKAKLKDIGSMIATGLKRLFTGNDSADAAKEQTKTTANVAQSAAKLTATQAKLLDAGLNALKDLLTTGEIDINTYAQKIKDACKTIEQKNAAGTELNEQKQTATERNEEIAEKLAEYGIKIEVSEPEGGESQKGGERTMTITQGGEGETPGAKIEMKVGDSGGDNSKKGNKMEGVPPEIQELLAEYQENLTIITGADEALGALSEEVSTIVVQTESDQQNIQVKKEELTQNIQQETQQINTDSNAKINQQVNDGNNPLVDNVVESTENQVVDTSTAAAAPGIAASLGIGSFGLGSGEAAKVTANGIADGIAAGVRTLTGSSALGGIVTNVASGQSLGNALQMAVVDQANNMISGTINELASGLQIGELNVGELVAPELADAVKIEGGSEEDKPQMA